MLFRSDQEPALEPGPEDGIRQGESSFAQGIEPKLEWREEKPGANRIAQGYALVEYATRQEAEAAIDGASGTPLLEQVLQCDFAFVRPPVAYVLS